MRTQRSATILLVKKKKIHLITDCSSEYRPVALNSGTPLLWTSWGPGEVSSIERCPHFRGKESVFGTQQSVLITEVSLFLGVSFKRASTVPLSPAAAWHPSRQPGCPGAGSPCSPGLGTQRAMGEEREMGRAQVRGMSQPREGLRKVSPFFSFLLFESSAFSLILAACLAFSHLS